MPWFYAMQMQRLREFGEAYKIWIEAASDGPEEADARGAAMMLAPKADTALRASGGLPGMAPPPVVGGFVVHGLTNIIATRYHESQFVFDIVNSGMGKLDERRASSTRFWINPINWVIELLNVVLGIPGYLVSSVFHVPSSTMTRRGNGFFPSIDDLLKLVTLIGGMIGIGRQVGWW